MSLTLRLFDRDVLNVLDLVAFLSERDEGLGPFHTSGFFDESLYLVLGADVIRRPHFLHSEAFGDEPDRIVFQSEC